jgi:DNA repair exonuclease SbcCD nuclease subunit
MTRVIHTADTHIGYRQYHSPERRRDFLDAFERVVEDAVEEDVDAVVHAGDIFHDRRPDLPDLLGTIGALRQLAAADVPFLAVVGNHEDKREAQWLDLFEELGLATRLDAEGVAVGNVTFSGLDYVPASRRDDLEFAFADPDTDHAALVAHGMFEPLAPAVAGDHWDTAALLDAATVDFDALLLGDNHHPDTARVEDAWVTYPGSTERVSAAEEADRGYNLVTFAEEVDVARRGLPTREFAFVDVDLREGEGVDVVRERVREHDLADAVVYVRVGGDGEPFPPAAVEEFAAERGALVARVNDRRDVEDPDADLDVSFADPDEAVRERVREMGLTSAAREVDETVRESGLADSNVREAVRDRVEELLEEDPAAFEGDVGTDEPDQGDAGAEADGGGAAADDERTEAEDDQGGATADDERTEAEDDQGGATADDERTEAEDDQGGTEAAADGEDQASVEDYL